MTLTTKQHEAMAQLGDGVRYLLYGGAGGGGKSWLGCTWLLLVCSQCEGVRYFVGRNKLTDTRASVLVTFSKVANAMGFTAYRFGDEGIKFGNGSQIDFLDLSYYPKKDPMFERFGSKEYTGGWIEEAGEVHALAFEVLKSRIGRFYKPWREGELKYPYAFIQALVEDNTYIGKDYIEALDNIKDRVTRERLRLGMWEYDDNPAALLDYDAIADLFTNDHCTAIGKQYISADVALKGRDLYVRANRTGDTIELTTRPIMEPDEVVDDIKASSRERAVPHSQIVVDTDGVGAYVPRYVGGAVFEFHGEARSFSGNYNNLKSECGYKLAELIQQRRLHVICQDAAIKTRLQEELGVLIADNIDNDTRKRSIITKDKMKAIIGHSPDILDTLLMLMVFEVRPSRGGIQRVGL